MIPSYWYLAVTAVLWQVVLHSVVAAAVLYAWYRHLRVPSGRTKRWLLCMLLVLPPITAVIPGRNSLEFREHTAWLDSMRILSVPLPGDLRVFHLVLGLTALTALASIFQEVLPALRRPSPEFDDVPPALVHRTRSLPAWEHCRVGIVSDEGILVATAGLPSRPRLIVSRDALTELTEDEMHAVLLHENAHWRRSRWLLTHALFLLRILQCYNPVALWIFREYSIEVEIDCDADAVAGRDPKLLARALLKVYESTHRHDVAARSTLRKRVDILRGKAERADGPLSGATLALATLILALLLPWVV